MADDNIFDGTAAESDAGKNSGFPEESTAGERDGGSGEADNGNGEGNNGKPGQDGHGGSDIEYTRAFKARVERMRRNERAKFEKELKSRDEAWEKRFKELEARIGGNQPKVLKREDFKSDEEFAAAKREAAVDEIFMRIDERYGAKAKQDDEARAKQSEAEESQRKFALKFQDSMRRNLSPEQQKAVISIANDGDGAVNTFLQSEEGSTLHKWLFDDCTIPADVILYLEQNAEKMERLATLSPRKQVEQLDILERYLAKAAATKKGQKGNQGTDEGPGDEGGKRPPVMGAFGGSSRAMTEFSQLSDEERVARLIKAMRKR
ncbi:MAG: hypothetical protein J6P62_05635 [Bacteroidales bacterium]|nr:hypothetical protein [Bacteroidales bacterium]